MNKYLVIAFIMFFSSCEASYNEINDFTEYYDKEQKIKKAEGRIYNGEEIGEWIFYSAEGYETQRGYYNNGLLEGTWLYKLPFIDSTIRWKIVDVGKCKFSLPTTYKLSNEQSDSVKTIYVDTVNHNTLAVSIIHNCDRNCIKEYYQSNLNEFLSHNVEVLTSQSTIVELKSGLFYIDEFEMKPMNYENVAKQYMVYKQIDDNKVLVIVIVNQRKYQDLLKFLVGEVFYHFKYDYSRLAHPYEEVTIKDAHK